MIKRDGHNNGNTNSIRSSSHSRWTMLIFFSSFCEWGNRNCMLLVISKLIKLRKRTSSIAHRIAWMKVIYEWWQTHLERFFGVAQVKLWFRYTLRNEKNMIPNNSKDSTPTTVLCIQFSRIFTWIRVFSYLHIDSSIIWDGFLIFDCLHFWNCATYILN